MLRRMKYADDDEKVRGEQWRMLANQAMGRSDSVFQAEGRRLGLPSGEGE